MATRAQLEAWAASLEVAMMAGIRAVSDQSGDRVEYASGREMAAALAAARRQLAASAVPVTTIRFNMTKGL